jgi:hypothetical protein
MTTEEVIPMDRLAKIYIKIRTKVQELTKDISELEAQKDEVANAMREQMKLIGSKSVRTDFGTVTMQLKTRYTSQDWDSFKTFMMQNDALDLVERRISQLNMAKFLEENPGLVPPGLNADSEYTITVKKPTN